MNPLIKCWRILAVAVVVGLVIESGIGAEPSFGQLAGQPVDIAPSAYQYRADRKAGENPPESWVALMWYAKQPLNRPMDVQAPLVQQVLGGWLWEEIRPVQQLELTWETATPRQPAPGDLVVTTINNQGASSSWWNNLTTANVPVQPTVSPDGKT